MEYISAYFAQGETVDCVALLIGLPDNAEQLARHVAKF